MCAWENHNMAARLLDCQFQALEVPDGFKTDVSTISILDMLETIIHQAEMILFFQS